MDTFDYILIGISVAMDAFTVTIAKTMANEKTARWKLLQLPFFFGFFQFAMPLLGGLLITNFAKYVEAIDHWIAFGLLLYIGGNMIKEAKSEAEDLDSALDYRTILLLSIATSIDALSVGISFAVGGGNVWTGSLYCGLLTALICLIGVFIGKASGAYLKDKAGILGGCILIFIGFKILVEHLFGL